MVVQLYESGGSLDDLIERVRTAWQALRGESPEVWSYVCDVFPEAAYVKYGDYANPKYWRVPYTLDDSGVTFAQREQWVNYTLDYVPVVAEGDAVTPTSDTPVTEASADATPALPTPSVTSEAATTATTSPTETTTVEESFRGFIEAPRGGKTPEAVLLVEGESANQRLYTQAALHSGIAVFSGRPVFADHPTSLEETQRPERSVRDVVGRLGTAYVGTDKHGQPALRAPVVISEAETGLRTKIKEGILGDLSIRAQGSGRRNAEGVFVVESFLTHPHTSVDLVTVGAAGGYVDLAESVREVELDPSAEPSPTPPAVPPVTSEATTQPSAASANPIAAPLAEAQPTAEVLLLRESQQQLLEENTRLFRQARTLEGGMQLQQLLRDSPLPSASRQRVWAQARGLIEAYGTHGSPQTTEQLQTALGQLVEGEKSYLAKILPHGGVTGLHLPMTEDQTVETVLTEAFKGLVPDDLLSIAVRGRQAV